VERSRSRRRRVGVEGPYHRHRRSDTRGERVAQENEMTSLQRTSSAILAYPDCFRHTPPSFSDGD
jgi:hypothetical protein